MDLAGAHHEAIHSDHPAPQEEVREERLDALILSKGRNREGEPGVGRIEPFLSDSYHQNS
jgi:hypothetical protein